jgi:hypothetical protein
VGGSYIELLTFTWQKEGMRRNVTAALGSDFFNSFPFVFFTTFFRTDYRFHFTFHSQFLSLPL